MDVVPEVGLEFLHWHNNSDMKKPDGSVEVFKFDFSKDCPSYVADFLWDNL